MALKLGTLFVDFIANTKPLRDASKEILTTNRKLGGSFSQLGNIIAAAFSVAAARQIITTADAMALLNVRVRNATRTQDEYNRSRQRLINISNQTGTALAGNVKLFEQLARAAKELGATNPQVLQLTENFNKLGAIGGSSVSAMANSQLQFSQAMAGGILRAEEFNSIIENTPAVIAAIGTGLNKTTGELRQMVLDGELLADDVFGALLSQTEAISAQFETLPLTMERVSQKAANNFALVVDEINKGVTGTQTLAANFDKLATKIVEIPNNVRALFTILFGELDQLFQRAIARINILGLEIKGLFDFTDASKETTALIIKQIEEQRDARIAASKAAIDAGISDEARLVAAKRAAGTADAGPVAGALTGGAGGGAGGGGKDKGPSKADQSRIERIRQLGESERQEIERIAAERRAFILEQDQLTADARNELLLDTEEERIRNLIALQDNELIAEAAHAAEVADLRQQQADSLVAAATSTSASIANLLRATGDDQAARAASIISGVATLATTIVTIMAAQAKAQAAADPTAITLPQKVANVALMSAQFVGLFAAVKGAGRQFGGSASTNLAHPVNEAGTPELLTQGSRQFLLPNGKGGTISPLGDSAPGTGQANVTIISNGTPQTVDGVNVSREEVTVMINDAAKRVEDGVTTSLATGRGGPARGLQRGFNVARNLR